MSPQSDTHHSRPSSVDRYANYLKSYYKHNKILPEHDKWFPSLKKFISLAVVEQKEVDPATADVFTKSTFHHGCIDVILKKKKPILLEDLLRPEEGEEDSRVILVEGPPGIGKSMMSWELCRQWDNFETLRRFSLIILFRLREKRVQGATTLVELIYHNDPQLQQDIVSQLLASEGKDTLLIFDGFDEVRTTCELLVDIIDSRKLCKSTVVITSRPSARAKLKSLCHRVEYKHVEILGFTPKKIEEYASSIFESNPSLLSDFTKYIDTSPAIRGLMYVPLNCCMVVEIYCKNRPARRPVPHTMTQLFVELSQTLLKKNLVETGADGADSLPLDIHMLPQSVTRQLIALGEMALEGVVKQEVIFDSLPEGCSSTFGFLSVCSELYIGSRGSISYNFIHLTLQEFVAAFYICQLPACVQKAVFAYYCECDHMDIVWRFVAGLSGMAGIGWDTVKQKRGLDEQGRVVPFLVECFYEAQEKVDIDTVLGEGGVTFYGSSGGWTTTPFDYYAVGYCVASSHCAWKLGFKYHHCSSEHIEMLVNGLSSRPVINGSIFSLDLSCNPIGVEGIAFLKGAPKKIMENIRYLDMSICHLDDESLDILSELTPCMNSLSAFDFVWSDSYIDDGLVKLLSSLSRLPNLKSVNITDNDLDHTDILALSQLIKPSGSIRKLSIGSFLMSVDCVEMMMETVFSQSSLDCLTLSVHFPTSYKPYCSLETNQSIQTLEFTACKVDNNAYSLLFKALQNNTILETLKILCIYFFGHEESLALAEMIKANHTLMRIHIESCRGVDEDSEAMVHANINTIITALEYNHSLLTLELPESYCGFFSSNELSSMDPRVEWITEENSLW